MIAVITGFALDQSMEMVVWLFVYMDELTREAWHADSRYIMFMKQLLLTPKSFPIKIHHGTKRRQ